MTQIEVPKIVGYALIGQQPAQISVSKIVGYVLMIPGSEEGAAANPNRSHGGTMIYRVDNA